MKEVQENADLCPVIAAAGVQLSAHRAVPVWSSAFNKTFTEALKADVAVFMLKFLDIFPPDDQYLTFFNAQETLQKSWTQGKGE